ncbi:MAG: hypothetical protein DRQ51_09320 [Gammaproteobacteria bacterium]|nr:MAG: hypothetical protein DRQ51_09320 [Gammaproteobacteria bacterium]
MNQQTENILKTIKTMPLQERAFLASCIIDGIDNEDEKSEQIWLNLSKKRFSQIKTNKIKAVS